MVPQYQGTKAPGYQSTWVIEYLATWVFEDETDAYLRKELLGGDCEALASAGGRRTSCCEAAKTPTGPQSPCLRWRKIRVFQANFDPFLNHKYACLTLVDCPTQLSLIFILWYLYLSVE